MTDANNDREPPGNQRKKTGIATHCALNGSEPAGLVRPVHLATANPSRPWPASSHTNTHAWSVHQSNNQRVLSLLTQLEKSATMFLVDWWYSALASLGRLSLYLVCWCAGREKGKRPGALAARHDCVVAPMDILLDRNDFGQA